MWVWIFSSWKILESRSCPHFSGEVVIIFWCNLGNFLSISTENSRKLMRILLEYALFSTAFSTQPRINPPFLHPAHRYVSWMHLMTKTVADSYPTLPLHRVYLHPLNVRICKETRLNFSRVAYDVAIDGVTCRWAAMIVALHDICRLFVDSGSEHELWRAFTTDNWCLNILLVSHVRMSHKLSTTQRQWLAHRYLRKQQYFRHFDLKLIERPW